MSLKDYGASQKYTATYPLFLIDNKCIAGQPSYSDASLVQRLVSPSGNRSICLRRTTKNEKALFCQVTYSFPLSYILTYIICIKMFEGTVLHSSFYVMGPNYKTGLYGDDFFLLDGSCWSADESRIALIVEESSVDNPTPSGADSSAVSEADAKSNISKKFELNQDYGKYCPPSSSERLSLYF